MLYLLLGERFWTLEKLNSLIAKAREKNTPVFFLTADSKEPISNYLSSGLFEKKNLLVSRFLLENKNYEAEIEDILHALASSENIFIFQEEEVSEKWEEKFKQAGAKIGKAGKVSTQKLLTWARLEAEKISLKLSDSEIYAIIEEASEDPWQIKLLLERRSLEKLLFTKNSAVEPNYFEFADAMSAKNKHSSLRLLRRYMKGGFGAEEAFWRAWWKIKTLRTLESGAKGLELHPFVQKKGLLELRNYSSGELAKISLEFLDLFSEVRRGNVSFEEGLERILINI